MKLRRLDLENFRQFYGRQGLSFSTDDKRNVTLVYGTNGGGKTSLLNAFTWGLYGETTPGLADPDWLVNNRKWATTKVGESVTVSVAIEFEDRDHVYTLTRRQTVEKTASGRRIADSTATLNATDSAGQNEPMPNLEGAIGAILPKRLYRFVFFDGERDINYLASSEATEEIKDAVKTVLGLEILERAVVHIHRARLQELNPELADAGDERDLALEQSIKALQSEDEELAEELKKLTENLSAENNELNRVEDELGTIQAAQELQQRRNEIEEAVKTAEGRIEGADRGIDGMLRRNGFLAFTPDLIDRVEQMSATLKADGQIPAPIKQPFVQKLLTDARCICGTALKEGSPEQEEVMAWFTKAGLPDVEERWGQIAAHTLSFRGRRDELYLYLHETLAERSSFEQERRIWELKESEIETQMTAVDDETARRMNDKRRELKRQLETRNREIGAVKLKRQEGAAATERAQRELQDAELQTAAAAKARERVRIASEAEELCAQLLQVRTQQTRAQLDKRLKAVFGEMCIQPHIPSLTEDYRLTLSTLVGGEVIRVAPGTAEGQILALSFIGVMAELARQRYEESLKKPDLVGLRSFHGGVFPLVLDAVFGTLDDEYQVDVAEALPELAPQVIVFVSRGSAPDTIRKHLWPKAGRIAVLTLHTAEDRDKDLFIELPSERVPYVVQVADGEGRTEIFEV